MLPTAHSATSPVSVQFFKATFVWSQEEMTTQKGSKAAAELVKRLLSPIDADSVSAGTGNQQFTNYGQSMPGYCKFVQSSGGYSQSCPGPSPK